MKILENYILRTGYNPNTVLCAFGDVYGSENFEDGSNIQTSKVVEHNSEYITTISGSKYYLKNPHPSNNHKRTYDLYLLKKGANALHKTGNIKRDYYDAELIVVKSEDDKFYIGNFAEGYGFIDVKFKKEDCRKATIEELDLCDEGKMSQIKF